MSRQSLIESYFRAKGNTPKLQPPISQSLDCKNMSDKRVKRRNLSLIKPGKPTKSPKVVSDDNKNISEVINLSSDDEDFESPKLRSSNLSQVSTGSDGATSDSSVRTIIYSLTPESPMQLLQNVQTPEKSYLRTPQKTPSFSSTPHSSQSTKLRSPSSANKFFSPTRNRTIVKRCPGKAKRSFGTEMDILAEFAENESFSRACKGMDDKTIFLLTVINKFLKEPSLTQLLDHISQGLLNNCLRLVKPGMRLVCRLYWRKEGWYKLDQIKEISEGKEPDDMDFKHHAVGMEEMIHSLMENGLLVEGDTSNMSFDDFTSILTKDEIKQICKELKLKHADNKQDAVAALASFSKRSSNISTYLTGYTSNNSRRVLQMMNKKIPPRYKLSELARTTLYKLYLIMYLGMDFSLLRDKKLEFMLLCDKTRRETYPVDKDMLLDNASIVFGDRDDFERYITAHLMHEDFLTRTDVLARCDIVTQVYNLFDSMNEDDLARYKTMPTWLRRYTPPYVYIKILEAGIQELKKSKSEVNYYFALEVLNALISQNAFRVQEKAHWYDEKALILHSNMCLFDKAAEVLIEGFKSDLSEEAKDSLRPRARKLAHQKNITLSEHLKKELLEYATKENILEKNLDAQHIYKQPMDRTNKRGKVKFETRTAEGRTFQEAEEYCIAHYINSGEYTHGEHWESRIVTTIYFLLFWDIIYSKPPNVQGVFLTYYQVYPLDMFTDRFYENRKTRIDQWLDVIEKANMSKLLRIMHETWETRPKCELSGINRNIEWQSIAMVASCLGPVAIAAICKRLAVNYKYTHSGFPDLTLWNEITRKIKFVEVKTDTDKPSMKQIQWMQYLREHGIETEFCYLGANTARQRSRNKQPEVKTEQ